MYLINYYYNNIVKYDLINKFYYKNIKQLPNILKIILNFNFKKQNIKNLMSSLIALELISSQKPIFTKSKISNITLKIRKGQPVGCKITLRKQNSNYFILKLINEFFYSKSNKQETLKNIKTTNFSFISFQIKNSLIFPELETNYQIFKQLTKLNITIVCTSKTFSELTFLLKSYKITL